LTQLNLKSVAISWTVVNDMTFLPVFSAFVQTELSFARSSPASEPLSPDPSLLEAAFEGTSQTDRYRTLAACDLKENETIIILPPFIKYLTLKHS
jgi:hypothetical protein